jgi:hypothetical protein
VFGDRYHARTLKTARDVHVALRYVLMNARKHELGVGRVPYGQADVCSSAAWFNGWSRPRELVFGLSAAQGPPPVAAAKSWLLRVGFRRAGLIDVDSAPRSARRR